MSDGIHHARETYYFNMAKVRPGMVYKHFKGGSYVVLAVSWDCDDHENKDKRNVTYMNLETGKVYHRKLEEFVTPKKFEDGSEQIRFVHVGIMSRIDIDERGDYIVTRKF